MEQASSLIPEPARQEIAALSPIVEKARAITIQTGEDYIAAGSLFAQCRAAIRRIRELVDPTVEAANKAHKAATSLRANLIAPFEEGAAITERTMVSWRRQQEAIAEKLRREQEMEATRQAEIARKKADEDRLALADKAEELGDTQTRDAILDSIGKPTAVPPMPVVTPTPDIPKVAGQSARRYYKAEVVNLDLLIEAAAKNKEFRVYLEANETQLRKTSEATQGQAIVPGVRFYYEDTLVQR